MDPITIEAIAQIKRHEFEAAAAHQSIADQLGSHKSAKPGLNALSMLLAALGLTANAI